MGLLRKLLGGERRPNYQPTRSSQPEGFYIVRYDYGESQAKSLFAKANAGDIEAQLTIAKCFMDAAEQPYALPWYEKAAALGSSQALYQLTYFYEGRYVGVEADPVKAEKVRNMALEEDNPNMILKLASQYYTGDGVEMSKEKAFQYYKKAAELGSDEGMAEVGICYLKGIGVQQNDNEAFFWLNRSRDERYGYYHLAQCYLKGIGTARDIEQAVSCLEKAVNCKCLEISEARRQLLDLYSQGYGGTDADKKQKRLTEAIERSDKLMDDLADLAFSEE